MKMIKTVMAGAVAMALVSFGANADPAAVTLPVNQGQGVVNFKGTVINSPCSIAQESADQTINFGQISKNQLEKGGTSVRKDLDIKLMNCDFTAGKNTIKVTFSGTPIIGHNNELGTTGDTGTAIARASADGSLVTFDGTTAGGATQLKNGDNILKYSAWVKKSSATGATIKEGDFSAVANFNLTYQ